jgi:hypothetical protein
MRLGMDATRISDGRQVILKRLLTEEGPYELDINKLFSTEPLASNPRNRCVHLLDVIEIPDDPPILVHPLLRPYDDPRFQTYGEFITFFAQICEVSLVCLHYTMQFSNRLGRSIHAREQRRSPVCRLCCAHSRS